MVIRSPCVLGGSQVQQHSPAVGLDHDVVRADIPMDNTCLMHEAHGIHQGKEKTGTLLCCHDPIHQQGLFQCPPLHIVHGNIGCVVFVKYIPDPDSR